MNSELIVEVKPKEVSIAILEDKNLVELQKEARNISFSVGDIYLGKVKKLMPGLNAAFVDVGYEKDAFLHYLDLSPQFQSANKFMKQLLSDRKRPLALQKFALLPESDKNGSIAEILKVGQEVVVQIAKEPISTKGPRLSAELSYAGRFLVLIPFTDKVSVSQKIKSAEERARLKQLIQSIKPKNFGVIVRTVAEEKRVAELDNELKVLVKEFEDSVTRIQKSKKTPSLIFEETGRTVGIIRDIFNPSFQSIYIDDKDVYNEVLNYVTLISPSSAPIVKFYSEDEPIFDHFAITKQIKSSFGKTVSFKGGAYLIIEHTEALHVIDVNSGNRSRVSSGQEENAIDVNLLAANEISRQLRLRDLGGIIIVDFIDMASPEHRQQLFDRMRDNMASDRARHNILPLSKFGLLQITRQRVRPELTITTSEECPTCHGKGEIQPSLLFTDVLENKIEYMVETLHIKQFNMHVHPYIAAYINKGVISLKTQWKLKYGMGIKIVPNQNLAYLEYQFFDKDRNEIDPKEEKDLK